MPVLLFVAYPLLAHLGVMLGQPALQWLALQCLFAGVCYPLLRAGNARAALAFAAFASATWLLSTAGGGLYALYVPPLALTGLALFGFAQSLRPGQTPLVTRVAQSIHGPLSPELLAHTRRMTLLWTALLAAMLAATAVLTLAGPRAWWSLFTNFISYALMGLMFAAEFAYRRWRFPQHDRDGFIAYLRQLVRSGAGRP